MKFLSVSVSPRAAAMADAVTTASGSAMNLLYNPAGMAYLDGTADVVAGQTQWIADVTYNAAAAAFRPMEGRYGVFGVTVLAVDFGDFLGTIRADNERGYEDTGTYSPSSVAVGLGYARPLSDRFSVGAHARYVRESLGSSPVAFDTDGGLRSNDYAKSVVSFDFGMLYRTGFQSLDFAASVRNFAREVTYAEESFELPITFNVGVSMDVMDIAPMITGPHALVLSVEGQRPRDFAEQVRLGAEYTFMDLFSLRAGYAYPTDEQGLNLGAGLQSSIGNIRLGVDYAYTQFGVFGDVNRLAIHFGL